MDPIAAMAKRLGMQEKFQLPVASQSFGTVPSPAWKEKKYGQPWALYDTVNATIGQGYMLANPLQLAVMATRLATGRQVMPRARAYRCQPERHPGDRRRRETDRMFARERLEWARCSERLRYS